MSSKQRIQTYLKQNKISELFEEMMGKLIHDLPSKPVDYLIQLLQNRHAKKKVEVQQTYSKTFPKPTSSSSNAANLWNDDKRKSPAKSPTKQSVTELDGKEQTGRQYSKPWLSNTKKDPKQSLSQTLPSPTKSHGDNKLNSTSMDLNEMRKSKSKSKLEAEDEDIDLRLTYAKPKIYGRVRDESDSQFEEIQCQDKENKKVSSKPKQGVVSKQKRKQELSKILASQNKEKKKLNDDKEDTDDDDAVELCEDYGDLHDEGVKNPPKSGVHISKTSKRQKEEIELVLNMSRFFDSLGGAVSVTHMDGINPVPNIQEDDDFESASQVTGPRRPVWETPQSDIDTIVGKQNRRTNAAMFDLSSKVSKSKSRVSQTGSGKVGSIKEGSTIVRKSKSGSLVEDKLSNHPKPTKSSKEPSVVSAGRRSLVGERSRKSSQASVDRPKTAQ